MKRTIALGAAWTASAAAAVGLGFLAVSLVDASATPGASPVATTTALSVGSPLPTASPSATSAADQYVTPGGTVYADCGSGSPVLAGVPAAGWSVDDSNDVGEMEFESGRQKVEVQVSCVDGVPVFRLDDSSAPQVTPSPSATPRGDDHGGHGADDPAGDDSAGRSGGGHGADD
jgi:hypothetical protein